MPTQPGIRVREYGTSGDVVVLVHGGPGAPGSMAEVARRLANSFRILEPMQRRSGGERLTVARHVQDLHDVLESHCRGMRPAVIGHSWGAMLALAYAAAHPDRLEALVLVGCGTFDVASRDRLHSIREERTDDALRLRLERLSEELPDPDERLEAIGNLLVPVDSYDVAARPLELERCDARGYDESWQDMLSLQERGTYPAAFGAIEVPILMLHGAVDPCPGHMIFASLKNHVPQLEYHEWERCGHYPWLEKAVQDDFYVVLEEWLARKGVKS